jgi:hypothetical protein
VAIQRGPLIYCAEWPDNNTGNVLSLVLNQNAPLNAEPADTLLGGIQVIKTKGAQTQKTLDGKTEFMQEETITLIPYALWNNRGPGQMKVWLPIDPSGAGPLRASTIAFKSKIKASSATKGVSAVNDQMEPENSNDHSVPYSHWWPAKDSWEWIQYDFDVPRRISKTKVYWFDDEPHGGCRIPDEWELLYLDGNVWKTVKPESKYTVTKDAWDSLAFVPVKTASVKIKVKLKKDFASGVHEWTIE